MMTGYERSNLGEVIKAHGGLVAADPYPDQHFFQRSDNYSLALKGIVAHTFSGWAVTPTYHDTTDTVAKLEFAFMTKPILDRKRAVTGKSVSGSGDHAAYPILKTKT